MDIWKIVYWCVWLHFWFSIIYAIDVLRRLFWDKTPTPTVRKEQARQSAIEAYNMLKDVIGGFPAYFCIFLGTLLSTLVTFSYIRNLFRKKQGGADANTDSEA